MDKKQLELFESDKIWKSMLSMIIPSLLAILVMLIYNMADMIFVGQTGQTAQVAAVSVVGPVFSIIMSVALLLAGGGSIMIASELGRQNLDKAKTVSSLCMWGATISGIVVGILIIIFANPLLNLLGATEEMWDFAYKYMVILALGTPFLLISNMLGSVMRSEGAIKEGLIGNIIGTVINIVLDPILILGLNMGVVGAAIATVCGNIFATTYYGIYMKRKALVLNMKVEYLKKEPILIFSILALGVPNAVSTLLSGIAGSFSNNLLRVYGTDAIAANAAAGRVNLIIVMVLMGLCMGVQPLMAYNFGAGNFKKLKAVLIRMVGLTVGFGGLTTLGVVLMKKDIIHLFLTQPDVAVVGEEIVSIFCISAPFLGLFYLSCNFIQATGAALKSTIMSALQKGVLLIPLLYVMNKAMGFYGIIWAHVVADLLAVAVGVVLFFTTWHKISKDKRQNNTINSPVSANA